MAEAALISLPGQLTATIPRLSAAGSFYSPPDAVTAAEALPSHQPQLGADPGLLGTHPNLVRLRFYVPSYSPQTIPNQRSGPWLRSNRD